MPEQKCRVFFLGSGPIAVPVLAAVANAPDLELVGIGTQADSPAGRQRQLHPTPVGQWAAAHGIETLKPKSVNTPEFLDALKALEPEIVLVISFGQILKEALLALPKVACVNIHASLLPKHRGASPIAGALLAGDAKTGVSFMRMERGLDTGPVYCQFEHEIGPRERCGELEAALGMLAAKHVAETLIGIASGRLTEKPQEQERATLTRKISKEDGAFEWCAPAAEIAAKARAYHPWPGAHFTLETPKRRLSIRLTQTLLHPALKGAPGEVLESGKNRWIVACGKGAIELLEIVPEGKKEMSGAEFLRGCPIPQGAILASAAALNT